MRVSCPSCQTNYNIDDKRVPPGGAKLKCSKCQTLFPIKAAAEAVPLPGSGAPPAPVSGAIPLPGSGAPPAPASGAIPLPGLSAAQPTAIPLPGLTAAMPQNTSIAGAHDPFAQFDDGAQPGERWDEGATRVTTLPLPSEAFRDSAAIPLPMPGPAPDLGPEPVTGAYSKADLPASLFNQSDASIPLPGGFRGSAMPFDDAPPEEVTRVVSIPLPGGNNDAARMAAAAAGGFDFDFEGSSPAPVESESIPLPGAAPSGDFAVDFSNAPGAPMDSQSIPLPGGAGEQTQSIPLPGAGGAQDFSVDFSQDPSAETGAAIPLPGDLNALAPPPPPEAPGFDIGWDNAPQAPVDEGAAFAADFGEPPPAPAPAPAASFDFGDLPSPAGEPAPAQDFAVDFSQAAAQPAAIAPPPPASADFGLDFSDLPSPRGEEAPVPEAIAPPPPAPDFSLDFGDLPSPTSAPPPAAPAPDFSLDFGDLPQPSKAPPPGPAPAARPSIDLDGNFGDFGEAPAAAASSAGGDDLEFDPMNKPRAGGDDFEADLSAPLPPAKPAEAADGLEMLSFIDDQSKDQKDAKASPKKRFHIRRRSGKTFGPFEEGVVVKMLEDGQLLGNEDVSPDGDQWTSIGSVPAFSGAIQKMMAAPAAASPLATATEAPADGKKTESSAQAMERLKNLYEGRMAAVTVVDKRAETEKLRKRIPFFVAGGVVALLLMIGGALGFTRYGVFALKVLLPAKVQAGSPQFTQLQKAREALAQDTFKSYSEARDTSQAILNVKEFPEVRAVWCQAIFYLDRRYTAAKPAELALAVRELTSIQLLGEKHPEVVKALAGSALSNGRADEARLLLEDAAVRHPGDGELKLLLAEAYVARKNPDRAIQTLEQVLTTNAGSAKALHMLGTLHQKKAEQHHNAGQVAEAKADASKAQELYEKALAADPNHVISAVELAAIELLVHGNVEAGSAALTQALEEKSRALMGPAEIARARALNGTALSMNFRVKEAMAEFEEAVKLDRASVFAKAQLGRIYLQQREFGKAVPLFKEASQKEPSNLDYVDGYLTVLIGAGKMQDALSVLQTANGQFPDTPRIAYLDARVNDALDNTKKAEDNYLRAVKSDPTLYDANLHLARLYLRLKRLPEARKQLEGALEKAPDNALVNAGMGELLLEEGDVEQARLSFEKSVSRDPNLPDARLGLSRAALQAGRVEDAETAINDALKLDPTLKGAHLQKGLVLFKQNRLDDAIAALEDAKKNEPSNAKISIQIGAVKLEKRDLAGAEASLGAALAQEPRNHVANFFLARVKSKQSEHTQAIESMRAALDANPSNAEYHHYMGLIYREAKKNAEALEEWKKTVELDPTYADAMEALGQAYLERGEFDGAIAQFEAALKVDPTRARLLGSIGDAHYSATNWDLAIKTYRQALQADNSLTYVYYKIGRALEDSGKSRDAIDWYKKSTDVEPENPMPWLYLGYLQKGRAQRKDAVTAFKKYLALRADAPEKKEIEDEIYDLEHGN